MVSFASGLGVYAPWPSAAVSPALTPKCLLGVPLSLACIWVLTPGHSSDSDFTGLGVAGH